jgi:hypothetical protein
MSEIGAPIAVNIAGRPSRPAATVARGVDGSWPTGSFTVVT